METKHIASALLAGVLMLAGCASTGTADNNAAEAEDVSSDATSPENPALQQWLDTYVVDMAYWIAAGDTVSQEWFSKENSACREMSFMLISASPIGEVPDAELESRLRAAMGEVEEDVGKCAEYGATYGDAAKVKESGQAVATVVDEIQRQARG